MTKQRVYDSAVYAWTPWSRPLGEPDTTELDPSEGKLLETISEGFFMFLFYLIQSEVCRTLWSLITKTPLSLVKFHSALSGRMLSRFALR